MSALTFELMRSRAIALVERLVAEGFEPDETLWTRVVCDGCGCVVVLLRDPFPVGWTTTGDDEGGWTDLCRSCSQ